MHRISPDGIVSFSLRKIGHEDVETVRRLADRCVGENLYSAEEISSAIGSSDRFFHLLQDEHGSAVGYIYYYLTTEEALAEYSSDEIKNIAEEVIAENGADYSVSVEITNMWFETRSYDGFTLPAGDYDAVRIIIGAGEGHNWWCVMYPPLCIPGAENALEKYGSNAKFVTSDGFEIRFALLEWLENLKKSIQK